MLWPTPVQGEGAAEKIAAAIEGFNKLSKDGPIKRPDVIIVARGGGSLEDLWPFNEDVVIRAVFASEIPLISAVGHETDTMLIDYVSDKRAPTPTGAAEFAVPVRNELYSQLMTTQSRLVNGTHRYLEELKNRIEGLGRGIPKLDQILNENTQKLDDRIERLKLAFQNFLTNKKNQVERTGLRPYYILNIFEKKQENLKNLAIRLDSVSIDSVLKRGFAWVRNEQQKTVYDTKQAKQSSSLEIKFIDGSIKTKVVSKKNDSLQGDLFDFM